MSKNAAITTFFRPVPKVSSSSQIAEPELPQLPSQPEPSAQTPPRLPSCPSSALQLLSSSPPAPAVRTVRDRNAVIRGSDDEDSDASLSSDDDLPDLFAAAKAREGAVARPSPRQSLCVTPRAKRTALEFSSSPLTIRTKGRHKFDMKALMEHAAADSAFAESELRIQSLLAQPESESDDVAADKALPGSARKNQSSMHETMMDVFDDPSNSEAEAKREKLVQAVKRTEVTVQKPRWCFFDHQDNKQPRGGSSIEARMHFPRATAVGIWAFLTQAETRSQLFEDGIVFNIQEKIHIQEKQRKEKLQLQEKERKGKIPVEKKAQEEKLPALPDDIFLWVLREIYMEKSRKLRDEYIRLLGVCEDQVSRLVDPNIVDQLFRYAGASERVLESPSTPTYRVSEDRERAYIERDKTPLRSTLRVLTESCIGLSQPCRTRCVAILLRLGMDNLIREDQDFANIFQEAFFWLVWAVPDEAYDTFCADVCTSLHAHIKSSSLRCDAAFSIPLRSPPLIELRRRLALVCVFDDPSLARGPADAAFSLPALLARLDAPPFRVGPATDFFELGALAELLGLAIGDGSPPPPAETEVEARQRFNADVDALAHRVKVLWSGIHGQGAAFASRLDARVTLQDLERKLQNATRTRPPPRTNIFDIRVSEYDEVERPKQQKFLQRFLGKGKGKGKA
ncbi:hypothetical protein B0T18DRAFT_406830 [Schizothecium vesticola]|uniref:Uncharacterized protein n=1 Tax=Schizothecium vesticola TaxID=314040 RepID=A0AA40K835_9PEZI|nr:hypothetical protein B0T18DRAFT_406830 [Schizothecium vesticola]